MADLGTGRIALMREWRNAKSAGEKPAEGKELNAENAKREAWELWKIHAVDADSTLRERLEGRKPNDWPVEKAEMERKLFEEFWAEQ
jgi:hypothetical protein